MDKGVLHYKKRPKLGELYKTKKVISHLSLTVRKSRKHQRREARSGPTEEVPDAISHGTNHNIRIINSSSNRSSMSDPRTIVISLEDKDGSEGASKSIYHAIVASDGWVSHGISVKEHFTTEGGSTYSYNFYNDRDDFSPWYGNYDPKTGHCTPKK